jgi:hypothetical protein
LLVLPIIIHLPLPRPIHYHKIVHTILKAIGGPVLLFTELGNYRSFPLREIVTPNVLFGYRDDFIIE